MSGPQEPQPRFQPYPPYAPPPPYNVYAILSLALGLAVFPPLGIYFGSKAKQQIAQTGERGIELAQAGLVCGWVLTALLGIAVAGWAIAMAVLLSTV